MMENEAHRKIRSVKIYWVATSITSLKFFDKDGEKLWEVAIDDYGFDFVETVYLAENEVIIGLVARLKFHNHSELTDFQL